MNKWLNRADNKWTYTWDLKQITNLRQGTRRILWSHWKLLELRSHPWRQTTPQSHRQVQATGGRHRCLNMFALDHHINEIEVNTPDLSQAKQQNATKWQCTNMRRFAAIIACITSLNLDEWQGVQAGHIVNETSHKKHILTNKTLHSDSIKILLPQAILLKMVWVATHHIQRPVCGLQKILHIPREAGEKRRRAGENAKG